MMKWGSSRASSTAWADEVQVSFKRSEEARARAEEANKLKSDFLANMSHELRTTAQRHSGLFGASPARSADPEQQEFAATIHSSGQHLLDIVNDLLDLAKIEAGRIELKWQSQDVVSLATEIANTHRAHAQAKGLTLELTVEEGIPRCIDMDVQRVRQILNNLLNNAIKFTDNGRIGVNVRQEGKRLAFAVSDTGRASPPKRTSTFSRSSVNWTNS
jgi:two-component system sensor histidine kinase BarA